MKYRCLTSATILGLALFAACTSTPEERFDPQAAAVDRIIDACLERGRTWEKLQDLCTEAPHRLSGSEGAAAAVEWARTQMVAEGLENVQLEECTVPFWERGSVERLAFTAPGGQLGKSLPILALGGSVPTPEGGIEAEVIVVEGLAGLKAAGQSVRDKIVLFNEPMDASLRNPFEAYGRAVGQRGRGPIEAARLGAVAAIVRSITALRDDVPHTGALRYENGVERIPGASVSTNGADEIARLVASGNKVRLKLELDCRWNSPALSYNVVGELVGREFPEEIVVIGAHLDAWDVGQGAHDDGAGCCQVMEALRILKVLGLRPRRTIRCVLFMNEENGLAGAHAYFERHWDDLKNTVLAIESDAGAFTPRGFTTDANDEALEILQGLGSYLAPIWADAIRPGGGGADISVMAERGVILVGYRPDNQRYFDLHHSAHDTLDKVNERELELGTASIAALAYLVAELPERLPANPVEER